MGSRLVAVMGPCSTGKSTLVASLRANGVEAREVHQEHSYAPHMWERLVGPDFVIYLDASLETVRRRRGAPAFPAWMLEAEVQRLRYARERCDLYIATDALSPGEVLAQALRALSADAARRGERSP